MVGTAALLPNHSLGWTIIFVTILVRLILLPFSLHQAKHMQKNQQKMADLKGEIQKINDTHKDNPTEKNKATMALYRKAGINPVAGCLPLLIQLPVLIAIYRVFLHGLGPETWHFLYPFVRHPETLQVFFFGFDVTKPNLVVAILAGVAQFFQVRMMSQAQPAPSQDDDSAQMMAAMQKNTNYIFPAMAVFIALRLPAALPVYWIISSIFAIAQQYYIKKYMKITLTSPVI
jgi:YidC/Oxa1 family membrane protein insertase